MYLLHKGKDTDRMNNSKESCDHSSEWVYAVVNGAEICKWCHDCGELWFLSFDNDDWYQRHWTEEEINQIYENAEEISEFFK